MIENAMNNNAGFRVDRDCRAEEWTGADLSEKLKELHILSMEQWSCNGMLDRPPDQNRA